MNDQASVANNVQSTHWRLRVDEDRVAWLSIDVANTSANALSKAVLLELEQHLVSLEQLKPKALIIDSAKASGFVAGADVKEFVQLSDPTIAFERVRAAQLILDKLEALPCPTVAAINGFALGGGLELALACRYRVAIDDPKVTLGLPEVMLGIHPGFGGTIRTVRLIGALKAMDLILTGRNVRAQQALKLGLLDAIAIPSELASAAKSIALRAPAPHRPRLLDRLANLPIVRSVIAGQMRKQVARKAKKEHYPAPYAAIDLWEKYGASDAAYEAEARSIAQLFCTATSRNLVRVFLLQDRLKGLAGKSSRGVERVHVVGAGVMGGDIAAWCAYRGLSTSLQDRELKFVQPALDRAQTLFEKRLKDATRIAAAKERLQADVEGVQVAQADVIIEAIYENADAKRELYARVEPKLKAGAILATNTSSIVLEELSAQLQDPGRLVGVHFFNPVAQMQLVEVVQTAHTHVEVQQAAIAFVRRLDKLPVPCKSAPGFVVNRVLTPYLTEAMLAVEEGMAPELIDKVAEDFGMPTGPIELADVVGLDVAMHVGQILAKAFNKPTPSKVSQLVAEKKLGRKSGQGFYQWQEGKAMKAPVLGVTIPSDLIDRMVLVMLNEAVAVLREGVVADMDLLDAAMIFGTGFAPFRGGPLHYAKTRGVNDCVTRLKEFEQKYGARFKPDIGWATL
jgi:3-hydroxyacyl-CoA dehydrogenase / enoyl-CoA hydratase / 3-hydroxybutyryl-CoA epimerase